MPNHDGSQQPALALPMKSQEKVKHVNHQLAADLQTQRLQVGSDIEDAVAVCSVEQDFHPEIMREEHKPGGFLRDSVVEG